MPPTNQQLREHLIVAKTTIKSAGLWNASHQESHDHLIGKMPEEASTTERHIGVFIT